MRAASITVALLVVLGGCGGETVVGDLGISLRIGDEISDLAMARVRTLVFQSSGDESNEDRVSLARELMRVEQLLYKPMITARSLSITVLALDDTDTVVAQGNSPVVAVDPARRTLVEILLGGPMVSTVDGSTEDAMAPQEDGATTPPDMAPDMAPACTDPAGSYGYVLRKLPVGATPLIDGNCNESYWTNAPVLTFSGANTSNNGATICRMLWAPGSPAQVYGCCQVTDADLRAVIVAPEGNVFTDDAVEYFFKGNSTPALDSTTSKVIINLVGTVRDTANPASGQDVSYSANVTSSTKLTGTINDAIVDTGYSIEWKADLKFNMTTGAQVGLLGFMSDDSDDPGTGAVRTTREAFGAINDPTAWRPCLYSCASP